MKKLLIAMTAAAVGTCAWATGEQTSTLLNENFNSDWANGAELEYMTALPEGKTLWSYSAETLGEGELKVVDDALGGKALSLNTGSKVLNAKFDAADYVTIPAGSDTGLYFKSTVTFSDPSDTLPKLGLNDKFALVVLDNIESVEEGSNTTNLWVIAGHKTDGKRAYLLQPFANDDDDYNLTDSWFDTPKTIEVRAIQNVMATGNLAGFIVKVENVICRVVESYPIVNDVIDMSTSEGATYLGYSAEEIDATYRKRYETDKTLIVSAASSSTLTSVDFQGQGVIDDVSLATTGSDFGPDATVLSVYTDGGIASVKVGTKEITLDETNFDGTYNVADDDWVGDETKTLTVTFVVDSDFLLKDADNYSKTGNANEYTATITKATGTNKYTLSLDTYLPKVSVVTGTDENGNPIVTKYGSLSEAIKEVAAGAELTLTGAITLTEAVEVTDNITINLNGKTLSATLTDDFASMFALADDVTLTITDTTGGVLEITGEDGRLIAKGPERPVEGSAVAINAGTIKADIANENNITYTLTGGQYDTDVSAVLGGNYVATKAEGSEYWTVAEEVVATTYAVTYTDGNFDLTWLNGETYEPFITGTELANGTYTFKVEADEDYKVDSVTVGNAIATVAGDGTFDVVVNGAAVAIVVKTREVKYPEAEGLVDGKVTTEVATALDELAKALGDDEVAVTNYITQVCGGNVNAATLTAAQTAGTIGLSANYDLPLMVDVPTVGDFVAEAASDDDAAAFSFQIKVDATPIEIKKVTDNVRKMIEYGTSLSGMNALTPQDTGVVLELSGTKIKVKLLKQNGVKSGFMKVKLNK